MVQKSLCERKELTLILNPRSRFPELDLMRFLAACAVMLFHYAFRGPLDHIWPASFPILGEVSKYGYLGVNVFFILSGFVILLSAYEKDAFGFAVARMVRLYPAYWTCVTLTSLAIILAGTAHKGITFTQFWANLTMAHSFFGVRDISGVYWTLAVELKFYFLIFLILAIGQVHRIRYWLGAWLLASIGLSLRSPHGILRFFLFPEWSSYFIAGAMFFLIHREGLSAYKLLVILGCYILSLAYALDLPPSAAAGVGFEVNHPLLILLLAVFYLTFLAIALRQRNNESSHCLHVIGLITYPLYLLHQELGYILLRLAPTTLNRYLLLGAVMGGMIGLAWLIQRGPERWLAFRLKSLLAGKETSVRWITLFGFVRPRKLALKSLKTPQGAVAPVTGSPSPAPSRVGPGQLSTQAPLQERSCSPAPGGNFTQTPSEL